MTTPTFSFDVDMTFLTPVTETSCSSIGRETSVSISAGLAPVYVVKTMMYGISISGYKSSWSLKNENIPNAMTSV